MALSEVKKDETLKAQAPAPAPEASSKVGGKKKDGRHDQFVAKGNAIRKSMSDEEAQLEGSKSDKVVFIGALGDPDKPQTRKENNQDIPSFTVVGYAFKALEDMEIPRADIKVGFKSPMDVGAMTTETVKAGETFYLNIFETGALISKLVYAGTFSGEGVTVGINVKFSQNREEPLPVLNKVGKGSVKENMILIADMQGADPSKSVKGKPVIKPEFASKFAVLYEKQVAGKKGTPSTKASGESAKDIAAAFSAYLSSRK